jgi:flagellar motor switch protein FliN/FliY
VADTIEYEQLEGSHPNGSASGDAAAQADLSRLSDIPMELSVEIGRTHMTVGETLDLRVGSVVALERLAGETADLLVNGSAIARGEVIVIDEQYGLRITEILDGQADTVEPANGLAAPADGGTPDGESESQPDAASSPASSPEGEGEPAPGGDAASAGESGEE